jgi:hypothetical protein
MPPLLRRIPSVWLAFLLALSVYSLAAGPTLAQQSIAPHYVYLADALLHGRLDLAQPPSAYDLLVVNGRAYVAGSPMPALLLLPFVAVFGAGLSDILFGVIAGALNVALVHGLFRRWWLTLLFAFGTPHLYLATLGSVWFNAHVVAVFFGLLALQAMLATETQRHREIPSVLSGSPWLQFARRCFLAGLWLACAGFARPTMLFGAVFFLVLMWVSHPGGDFTTKAPRHQASPRISSCLGPAGRLRTVLVVNRHALAAFGAAVAVGVAAHGLYNAARFGSPADFGYQYTAGAPNITSTYARYGGFNPRFLSCNLFVSILNPPEVNGYVPPVLYEVCGYLLEGVSLSDPSAPIAPNPLGMSLFLVTPAFALLLATRGRDPLTIAAWIGLLATMIPLWMYHNTGSLQFGYRYWMDATPMWLILMGTPLRRFTTVARLLILASIAINTWGFLWMFEMFTGATWLEMMP